MIELRTAHTADLDGATRAALRAGYVEGVAVRADVSSPVRSSGTASGDVW